MIRVLFVICVATLVLFSADKVCKLPSNLSSLEGFMSFEEQLKKSDIKRNIKQLEDGVCMHSLFFKEAKYEWELLLIYNVNQPKGLFWFLPHDDENSAFDSAVYAIKKYGGGMLSVVSGNHRHFKGQDPNRNFGIDKETVKVCKKQYYPAPLYAQYIFEIIDSYKAKNLPYMSLHNNKNGWYGNGGSGGVSILNESRYVKSYPSGKVLSGLAKGIKDEDSLVYIAGTDKYPNKLKLQSLLDKGIHVKYEIVNQRNNDCSMSNFVILNKRDDYFNIETEEGSTDTQKEMIDKIIDILKSSELHCA